MFDVTVSSLCAEALSRQHMVYIWDTPRASPVRWVDDSRSRHVGARGQQGHVVWVSVGQLQEAACLVRNEAVMHTNAAAADKLNVLLP